MQKNWSRNYFKKEARLGRKYQSFLGYCLRYIKRENYQYSLRYSTKPFTSGLRNTSDLLFLSMCLYLRRNHWTLNHLRINLELTEYSKSRKTDLIRKKGALKLWKRKLLVHLKRQLSLGWKYWQKFVEIETWMKMGVSLRHCR